MPLKLLRRSGSQYWYVRGAVCGQSVYHSTKLKDHKLAEAYRIRLENELLDEHVYGKKISVTFDQALDSYLAQGAPERFVDALRAPLGNKPLRKIQQNDLDAAARELYPTALSETRNRQCYTPFIAVWNHAAKNGWAEPRLWQRPRKARRTLVHRERRVGSYPVDYECAAQFVAAMSPAPAMVMTALFYTGLRPIELFALRAEDVDVNKRWIVVRSSKTGEPRGVPMHDFLVPLFAALVARGGEVFRTPRGSSYPLLEDSGGQLKTAINGARRRSGIRDVSPYTGRHSVSTQLVVNGVHPHVKDQILGHAVDDMSRHYTNVPQGPLIQAINTLPVPDAWRALPWWEDPVGWTRRLAEGTGKRTDLGSRQ